MYDKPPEKMDWEKHFEQRVQAMPLSQRVPFLIKWTSLNAWLILSNWSKHGTSEERRRIFDLGNPKGEYKDDDPRKYGHYFQGESGYTPQPGEEPFTYVPPKRRNKPVDVIRAGPR